MMKQEIYILTHKEIDNKNIDLSNYIPIQVGAALSDKDICEIKDNTNNNISYKNKYYLETTGIYWIWKNSDADIKGQMQFRRFLSVNPNFIQAILNDYDIITANPVKLEIPIQFHYEICHDIDDILGIRDILVGYYKDYVYSYDKYIAKGNILYYSNSFITKKETYDNLCEFCFSVLDKFEEKFKYYDDNILTEHAKNVLLKWATEKNKKYNHSDIGQVEYQKRVCAYLFERLVTLYIFHNKLNVYSCGEYIKMENKMPI